jgi:hypothetical protein
MLGLLWVWVEGIRCCDKGEVKLLLEGRVVKRIGIERASTRALCERHIED